MFHPMVAGVTIPGMGIFLLILAPYMDRNPSNKPEDRKFAISLFTVFLMFWAVLVIIGSFFRGPGFNFVVPVDRRPVLRAVIGHRHGAHHHDPLVIVIPVVVVLAGVRAVRRGPPSRHRRRPSARCRARPASATEATPASLAEDERAGHRPGDRAGRRHRAARPPELGHGRRRRLRRRACRRTPRRSASPAASSSTAASSSFIGLGLAAFGAAVLAFLWPQPEGRLRLQDPGRQGRRHRDARSPRATGFLYIRRGPHVDHRTTRRRRSTRPRQVYSPAGAQRHGGRHRRRCTRSARTSAAACRRATPRSGSSARATARSTTRSVRRRAARRLAAWTASPPRSPAACSPSTPAPSSRARRSAPTPPARRPRARTAWAEATDAGARQPGRARHGRVQPSAGVIAVVLIVGFVIAVVVNMRQGRAEVGSEIELAANRKPY